jgi:hypothetical protein
VDTRRLDHGAHCAARDHARSGSRRLEQHLTCAEVTDQLVRDGGADHGHPEHVLARLVVALADGLGNLVRLAQTHADMTRLVADDHERGEAEATATLHDLRHAVDVDDALLESLFV